MSDPTIDSPEITETLDLWVAGTEEPEFSPTDEGEQEISDHESEARLDEQFGRVVEDDYVFDDGVDEGERMILNMGPQHPSTHGVLRLQVELEGEIIRRTKPIIGYLHTGMEKTGEQLNFSQGGTNVTRMDYLAPFHNELAYSLAVERLLGIEVPPRAAAIRVLLTELNRCSSHLVALATNGTLVAYVENVMNNASAADIQQIRNSYPNLFAGGNPVPLFTYRFENKAGCPNQPPAPLAPVPAPPGCIREVSITMIVRSANLDIKTRQPRVITLTGLARRINPS